MRGSAGPLLFCSSSSRSKTTDDLEASFKRVCADRREIMADWRGVSHRIAASLCHVCRVVQSLLLPCHDARYAPVEELHFGRCGITRSMRTSLSKCSLLLPSWLGHLN
jgi:hypothetical protein